MPEAHQQAVPAAANTLAGSINQASQAGTQHQHQQPRPYLDVLVQPLVVVKGALAQGEGQGHGVAGEGGRDLLACMGRGGGGGVCVGGVWWWCVGGGVGWGGGGGG